jgi:hypothetical protein
LVEAILLSPSGDLGVRQATARVSVQNFFGDRASSTELSRFLDFFDGAIFRLKIVDERVNVFVILFIFDSDLGFCRGRCCGRGIVLVADLRFLLQWRCCSQTMAVVARESRIRHDVRHGELLSTFSADGEQRQLPGRGME